MTTAILNGQLKLQCGQWVRCGQDTQKSIYMGTNGRSIDAVHGGTNKEVLARFKSRMVCRRVQEKIKSLQSEIKTQEKELEQTKNELKQFLQGRYK